jgi:hypothetical protein
MGIHYIHYVYSFVQCTTTLTLCITASWSRDGAVFCVLGHLAMSSLLHWLDPTAAHYPFLGDRGPLPPKWHPFSQDLHTLPSHGSEQLFKICKFLMLCSWYFEIKLDLDSDPEANMQIFSDPSGSQQSCKNRPHPNPTKIIIFVLPSCIYSFLIHFSSDLHIFVFVPELHLRQSILPKYMPLDLSCVPSSNFLCLLLISWKCS